MTTMPVEFFGTPEEREANIATHRFYDSDRCFFCDAKMGSVTADWPCGMKVERVAR